MFNTTIIKRGETEYVPYEKTVTEIKAPTDESIRLLNEFREKILKETMKVFEVKGDQLSFTVRYCQDVGDFDRYAVLKWNINGVETVQRVDFTELHGLETENEINTYLIKKYAETVTDQIIGDFGIAAVTNKKNG